MHSDWKENVSWSLRRNHRKSRKQWLFVADSTWVIEVWSAFPRVCLLCKVTEELGGKAISGRRVILLALGETLVKVACRWISLFWPLQGVCDIVCARNTARYPTLTIYLSLYHPLASQVFACKVWCKDYVHVRLCHPSERWGLPLRWITLGRQFVMVFMFHAMETSSLCDKPKLNFHVLSLRGLPETATDEALACQTQTETLAKSLHVRCTWKCLKLF